MGVTGVGYEIEGDHKLEIHSSHKDKECWIWWVVRTDGVAGEQCEKWKGGPAVVGEREWGNVLVCTRGQRGQGEGQMVMILR